MTVEELDRMLSTQPNEEVEIPDEEVLPEDPIIALSTALVILQETGDLLEEILDLPRRKGRMMLPEATIVELQQASDTIYDFVTATEDSEEWGEVER